MIAAGHPPREVWAYTPRQIAGFLHFLSKRRRSEMAEALQLNAMSARSDPKDIKKQVRELEKE